jgi:hypothetical protein
MERQVLDHLTPKQIALICIKALSSSLITITTHIIAGRSGNLIRVKTLWQSALISVPDFIDRAQEAFGTADPYQNDE